MGRSKTKSSCFKIITCAHGDEVDNDDPIASPESKISSEKRRWSFRKRSAGHEVPSNTVISEITCDDYNKENSDVSTNNFDHEKSSIPEKSLTNETPYEMPQVPSVLVDSELNSQLVPGRNSNASDHNIKESDAVIIQAFIRGYLVRRELPKLKNVVKLQAAVRGHLVRRQAVGTLRCAQAIIKMQALVRARHARMFSKKLDEQEDKKHQMDTPVLEKRKSCMERDNRYGSTKSLLSNGFARQLLESTQKTKPIHISCDPSKSDSAWKWLERWMAITTSEGPQHEKTFQGFQGQEENCKPLNIESGNDVTYAELSISSNSKLAPYDFTMPIEDGKHLITRSYDFERDDQDRSQFENEITDLKQENDEGAKVQIQNSVFLLSQIPLQMDKTSEPVHDSTSDKPGSDGDLEKHNTIIDSSLPDALVDSHFHLDSSAKTVDLILLAKNSSHEPQVIAASECGTEISISSTLDSPDQSETEGGEIILELGSLERQKYETNGGSDVPSMTGNVEAQADGLEDYEKKMANPTTAFEADMQSQEENSINTTQPELHGTPSSQNSVNAKKNEKEMRKLDGKLISQINKRSPGSNTERLKKDSKNAKRRSSLGLDKPDRADQVPRISTSDSLPSYMQATESARAKAHGSISPKSSPDLPNKDNHLKKRHSLSIANAKQGLSPRMQKSPSQAQQNPKGNGTRSPHNSAERRWQR